MNIILLSGGSGKRLWPLSNDIRSKQFLKLLKNENGNYESMVQRVYGQIKQAGIEANIVVGTGASQVDSIHSQLGDKVDVVIEPERRDTFPAIALSASYLSMEKKVDDEEVVLVLPVDPYADIDYFHTLIKMEKAVVDGVADMVLMGIEPTYPSSKYGYILPQNIKEMEACPVEKFIEKPDEGRAQELIEQGAVWNGGVFAFKLGYLMKIVRDYVDYPDFEVLRDHYGELKKISFDYEVVEKASSIAMVSYGGSWKDLGTWNTLTEEMQDPCIGNVTLGEECKNIHVVNELSIPVVVLGGKDMIVAASPDGILVSDKNKSSYLKPYVENLNNRPMYEECLWGEYKVLDYVQYDDETKSLTKHMTIHKGKNISYLSHHNRDEVWTILDGIGELVIDGQVRKVGRGDVVYIPKKQKHGIRAVTDLHAIEVQMGKELAEEDCQIHEWDWK